MMIDDDRWIFGTFSKWILRYSSGASLSARGGRDIIWNVAVTSTVGTQHDNMWKTKVWNWGFRLFLNWVCYFPYMHIGNRSDLVPKILIWDQSLTDLTDSLLWPSAHPDIWRDVLAGDFLLGRWMCGCGKKPWEERSNALLLCAGGWQRWLCQKDLDPAIQRGSLLGEWPIFGLFLGIQSFKIKQHA